MGRGGYEVLESRGFARAQEYKLPHATRQGSRQPKEREVGWGRNGAAQTRAAAAAAAAAGESAAAVASAASTRCTSMMQRARSGGGGHTQHEAAAHEGGKRSQSWLRGDACGQRATKLSSHEQSWLASLLESVTRGEEVGVEGKPKGAMCAYVNVRTIDPQCLSLLV